MLSVMKKIAVVVVAYNRSDSLERLLRSLSSATYDDNVCLVISIDKSDVKDVTEVASKYVWNHGEKRIIQHNERLGLRRHVLSVGNLLNEFEAVIVLEDDVIVAKNFYLFAKACVEKYYDAQNVAGISLYNFSINYQTLQAFLPMKNGYDVYFMQTAQSWGQVWMRAQWKEFTDWYQKQENVFSQTPHLPRTICSWPETSWLKYHTKYCIETNKYFVYPYLSYSSNCGNSGTHRKYSSPLFRTATMTETWKEPSFPPSFEDAVSYDAFFENTALHQYLAIAKEDLCIDLNRQKQNKTNKRYWLTSEHANYKVLKRFGLSFRPIDLNIIENCEGEGIYLYDTSIEEKNKDLQSKRELFEYESYADILHLLKRLREYGIWSVMRLYLSSLLKKK